MARHKPSQKRPQPKHKKQKKSQHDKRRRLGRPNPNRNRTTNAKVPLAGAMQTAVSVLQAAGARWAIEEHFHDVKEVWGAGQQQVRNLWSNIGCWHLNQWLYTLVELCCWDTDKSELTDRRTRSWDNPERRPSHADRRRSISREMLQKHFLAALPPTPNNRKFHRLLEALFDLAI